MTIKKKLINGDMKGALTELCDLAEPHGGQILSQAEMLLIRYNNIKSEERMGTASYSEVSTEINKINHGAFQMLDRYADEFKIDKPTPNPTQPQTQTQEPMFALSVINTNKFIKEYRTQPELVKEAQEIRKSLRKYQDDEYLYLGPEGGYDRDKSKIQDISKKWRELLKKAENQQFEQRESFYEKVNKLLLGTNAQIVEALELMKTAIPDSSWDLIIAAMTMEQVSSISRNMAIETVKTQLTKL